MDSQEKSPQQEDSILEVEKGRDLFTGVALRGAVTLQTALGISEDTFRCVAGHALQDARAYYLYGVLDEVLKAATAMLRWQEFLKQPEKPELQAIEDDKNGKHILRVVEESLQDEQQLWARKLTELLCDLILFEDTNSQEYFRLFLTCEHLNAYLGIQGDFREFFHCESLNAGESIKSLISTVKSCTKSIILKKVWFLNDSVNWEKTLRPGTLFSSSRQRYRLALKKADADQKLTLGISYESAHSIPSRSIHANIGGPPTEVDRETVKRSFHHISLLCPQIILQAHKLAGMELAGDAEFVSKIFELGTESRKKMDSVYGKELEIGDIVFAYGKDLCIVVDKARSEYGYTSYKVRYLTPPLLPEVPEDWFPARYVHLVCPKKFIREQIIQIYEQHNFPLDLIEKVRNMPETELLNQMAATALAAFHEGFFDPIFKQKA